MSGLKYIIKKHPLTVGITTAFISVVALGLAWFFLAQNHRGDVTEASASDRYAVQSVNLPVKSLSPSELSSVQSLSINGQLNVNNSLILSPSGRPSSPVKGQLYYDGASNSLSYYDGTVFTSVADSVGQSVQDTRINQVEQQVAMLRNATPAIPADIALLGSNNTFSGTNLFDGSIRTTGLYVNAAAQVAENLLVGGSTTVGQSLTVNGVATLGATSISSLVLSTALPVTSGGTGVGSLVKNGVIIGNDTDALGAVSAGAADLCFMSTSGAPEFKPCPGGVGSGVNSLNGLYGSLSIANANASGTTVTINDAGTGAKGLAQFNATNFSVTGGVVNTAQDITVTAAPTFASLQVSNNATVSGALTIGSSCTSGQVLTTNGSGVVICVSDNTGTDTNTTYAAGNGISITGAANTISVNPQTGGGLSFTAGQLGLMGCTAGQILKYTGTAWGCAADADTISPGDGVGVTAVGTLNSQTKNGNGATIYNNGGILTVALQSADATNPGLITTGAQTFSGAKVFSNDISLQGNIGQSGAGTFTSGTGAVALNGNVTVASGKSLTLGVSCAANQVLTTNGSGVITCVADNTGTDTNTTYTAGDGISISGASNTIAVSPQNGGGLSFTSGQLGLIACTTGQILKYNGSAWGCAADSDSVSPGDGIGVTAVGALDGQTKNSNGAAIYNNGGTLTIALQSADTTVAGLISTGLQTFSGAKTFTSPLTVQNNFVQSGAATFTTGTGAIALNGDVTIASGKGLTLGASCSGGQVLTTNGSGVVICAADNTGTDTNTTYAAGDGIAITGASNVISVNPQTGGGLSFVGGQLGITACSNGQILKYNSGTWGCAADSDTVSPGDGVGVTAVGAFDGQTHNANGATIYNNAGTVTIALQSANGVSAGLVTAGSQTFGGAKTFANDLALQGGFAQTGSGTFSTGSGVVALNGNVTVASGKSLALGFNCATGQVLTTTVTGVITCVADVDTDTNTTYAAGNGISITGPANTIAVNPQTGGGLNFTTGQLGLIACSTSQILKYDGSAWVCSADSGVTIAAGSGASGALSKFSAGKLADSGLTESGTTLIYSGNVVANAASGFSGNLLDLQLNGTSKLKVSSSGMITAGGLAAASSTAPNTSGSSLDIRAGNGTGTGGSGYISFSTAGGASTSSFVKDLTPNGTYFKPATTVNTGSFSHTVTSGVNQVLLVAITASSTGADATSVTYGGQNLTRLSYIDQTNANTRSELWYLLNPTVGTATVSMNFASYRTFIARAMTLNDVNQSTPFGTPCTSTAFSNSASCTATTTGANMAVDITSGAGVYTSMGAGQTSIIANDELASGGRYVSMGYKQAGGATTTSSYTYGSSVNWAMISVPVMTNFDAGMANTMQERLRIANSGNIGINTLNPQYLLDVAGDINTSASIRTGGVIRISNTGAATFSSIDIAGATTLQGQLTGTTSLFSQNVAIGAVGATAGQLRLATTGAGTLAIQSSAQSGDHTITIPTVSGNDIVCLQGLANCSGGGSGLASDGNVTANALTKFNASGQITSSGLSEVGAALSYAGSMSLNAAAGYSGNLLNLQVGSNPVLNVASSGLLRTAVGVSGMAASGTNQTGGSLTLAAGIGTGTAGSGNIVFSTASAAASPFVKDLTPAGTFYQSSTAAISGSFTQVVSSGSNQVLLVAIATGHGGVSATAVTYGGVALTKLAGQRQQYDASYAELWYLVNPSVGSATVNVTLSTSATLYARAMTLTGVDQSTPFNAACGSTASTTSVSCNVDTTGAGVVLTLMRASTNYTAMGLGQQAVFANDTPPAYTSMSVKATSATSTSMSYTLASGTYWGMLAVGVRLADTSVNSSTIPLIDDGSLTSGPVTERMRIASNGNIGINTVNPQYQLDVGGAINTSTGFRVGGVAGVSVSCSGATQTLGNVTVSGGIITSASCATNNSDLAENYASTDNLSAGEIVMTSGVATSVDRATSTHRGDLIGVVSTAPGLLIGTEQVPDGYPVALSGRVPVKVSNENGPITVGDKITISSVAGVGMKATAAGMIVGTALEAFNGEEGTVEVFVNASYWAPSASEALQGTATVFTSLNVSGQATIASLSVGTVTVTSDITVHGLLTVANIVVNGHIITGSGKPTIEAQAALSGGSVTVDGTDTVGTITITTGAAPAIGELAKIVFSQTYAKAPRVIISPSNEAAAGFAYYKGVVSVEDFMLNAKFAPAANTTYAFDYFIAE